jgi:uncharacterized membrane protein
MLVAPMRTMLKPWLLVLFALLLLPCLLVVSRPARAVRAQEGWTIGSFDATYNIREDGTVLAAEDILVDFGTEQHHGIFRYIPVEFEYQDSDYHRIYDIDDIDVTEGNEPIQYETTRTGPNLVLKIGDPDVEVTGQHRYRITYVLPNAINPQDDQDEFFWNATGNDWQAPIQSASAVVTAPSIARTICFQGPTGSKDACRISGDSSPVFTSTQRLPPGSGLTIDVALPKGSIDVQPLHLVKQKSVAEKAKDFLGLSPLPMAGAVFLGILGVMGVGRYWWLTGRDRWYGDVHYLTENEQATTRPLFAKDTVVVEYQPPELSRRGRRLRPAEIGALLDERADTLDVTATIVDLAVRGYLRITEIEKTWIFGKKDYKLERLKEADADLLSYEASLLNRLFDEGNTVDMSDLKNEFYKDLAKVKDMLYTQVVSEDKFFPANPEKVRNYHLAAGVVIIVIGAGLTVLLGNEIGAASLGIPVIVAGAQILLTSHWMPRRTPSGREMYRRVLGFRRYMTVAETDRQRFNEEKNIFQEYLPYAMVYGCVDKWAKAFEDMGIKPDTSGWYVSPYPFAALAFSENINSFSSSLSSAITSTPGGSGSSGFGGGGFSGGGGGGGGGGAW